MTFPTEEQQQEGEQGAAVGPGASGGRHAHTQQPEEESLGCLERMKRRQLRRTRRRRSSGGSPTWRAAAGECGREDGASSCFWSL